MVHRHTWCCTCIYDYFLTPPRPSRNCDSSFAVDELDSFHSGSFSRSRSRSRLQLRPRRLPVQRGQLGASVGNVLERRRGGRQRDRKSAHHHVRRQEETPGRIQVPRSRVVVVVVASAVVASAALVGVVFVQTKWCMVMRSINPLIYRLIDLLHAFDPVLSFSAPRRRPSKGKIFSGRVGERFWGTDSGERRVRAQPIHPKAAKAKDPKIRDRFARRIDHCVCQRPLILDHCTCAHLIAPISFFLPLCLCLCACVRACVCVCVCVRACVRACVRVSCNGQLGH